MGFLAWARRLDDSVQAGAERRMPLLTRTQNLSPGRAAGLAFAASSLLMLALYFLLRGVGAAESPLIFVPPVLGLTIGTAIGASKRVSRR